MIMVESMSNGNTLVTEDIMATRQSSQQSEDSGSNDAKMSELNLAIDKAMLLLRNWNTGMIKSPIEDTKFSQSVEEVDAPKEIMPQSSINSTPRDSVDSGYGGGIDINMKISGETIITTISSLVRALNDSVRQIQQLKLKNMLLKSNSNDLQSSYAVEDNLKKQQFERMKYQFLIEKEHLLEKLRAKESKVTKYKSRVIEKNRQINKLTRILNENSTLDASVSETSESNTRRSVASIPLSTSSKHKASDMLKTLGILASQVLKDEVDDDSGNQTIPQLADNTTDSDIMHTPIFDDQLRLPSQVSVRGVPISNSSARSPAVELPKIKRFSTCNETIKNVD